MSCVSSGFRAGLCLVYVCLGHFLVVLQPGRFDCGFQDWSSRCPTPHSFSVTTYTNIMVLPSVTVTGPKKDITRVVYNVFS